MCSLKHRDVTVFRDDPNNSLSWKIKAFFFVSWVIFDVLFWSSTCICDNPAGSIMAIVLQRQGLEKANCAETH